jgi:hypothetical protein
MDGLPTKSAQAYRPSSVDTVRLNFDYTLKPTMLLHMWRALCTTCWTVSAKVDVQGIFGIKNAYNDPIPHISYSATWGGFSPTMGNGMSGELTNIKPTGNISLNWIREPQL